MVINDRGSFYLGVYYANNIYIYIYMCVCACDMIVCVIYNIYIYMCYIVIYNFIQCYTAVDVTYAIRCIVCVSIYLDISMLQNRCPSATNGSSVTKPAPCLDVVSSKCFMGFIRFYCQKSWYPSLSSAQLLMVSNPNAAAW